MKIEIHHEADNEISESAAFYEERVLGLGEEFVNEIEKAFSLLKNGLRLGKT
jgi:hypothetical protein